MRRRDFLAASALTGTLLPVRRAFADAAVPVTSRKFLFVVNYGGWDPTRVFAPEFDNPNVDMERAAGTSIAGGISFTDHEDRPSVRAFMQAWHERMLVLKGVLVPSVVHENCLRLCNWPAIMGGALGDLVNGSGSSGFTEQVDFAVDALSRGVSRCVTLSFSHAGWDTHIYNDLYQSQNFEMLFSGLQSLMQKLAGQPGGAGGTLADETVVVVLSEMGRTPRLNAGQGKDHWPYTSMMLVGPGFTADRVVGAYDSLYYGYPLDLATAEIDEAGANLSSDVVGATLLALAGVESETYLPGVAQLTGVLSG